MDADAILAAIRGVLLGTQGSVRTITAGTFVEGVPAQFPQEIARHTGALATPSFDVEIEPPFRTTAVGPSDASRTVLQLPIKITLTYSLPPEAVITTTQRRAVRAQATEHALQIEQALGWNLNLQTGGGNATNLINGSLRQVERPVVKREVWYPSGGGVCELELRFEGLVLETQAVS